MRKKQNGGPMLFVKNGGNLSAPSDRPGGPLISYYAKKGGNLSQANFTNYSGTQMYGTGGNFDYNLPSMKYSQTPSGQAYKNGGTIHINPANKGKFNATKARTGKSTEELTHSSNPVTKKRAVFAQNAAKWKHENGGPLLVSNQHVGMGGSLKMYDEGGALNVAYGKGGMIKRADGSYSQRGLWDNIRANAGSGKEPTKEMLQQERKITSKYKNGGMINPYAMNIVGKGLKKYLLGGPADETDGVISGNQTPFSLWSRNQNMPAQTQQEGVFNTASNQQRKNFVTSEFAPGTEGKGMSIPETPEPQDTFKNEKLAANSYNAAIQAGTSFIGNFAETNRRKSEGAHDTGFGSDVKGAAKGMGTGASLGSTFGPIGTAVGAAVGGVAGYFVGKGEGKVKKRAYDAWQADYKKAEQSRIDSNSSRYQDLKPTSSGYYAKGGKMYKYKPSSVSTTMPQFTDYTGTQMYRPGGQLPTIYVTDPNDKRLRSYKDSLGAYNWGNFGTQEIKNTNLIVGENSRSFIKVKGSQGKVEPRSVGQSYRDQGVSGEPIRTGIHRPNGVYNSGTNQLMLPESRTVYPAQDPNDTRIGWNANYKKPVQPVELKQRPVNRYPDAYNYGQPYQRPKPSMQSLHPHYMQSSPVSMQGQPMQIQPMTLPQQKGKPVYGPGSTIIGYNGEDGKMRKAYQYTGAPNNELNLQDKALLEDKDKWQQYLSSRDSGYKFATGGSMASNYMSKQKAVGGSLVPLSSDAVEVKGPSHANGGVKLPEMEAEVEGKEVIKDDYVFSEQLGFAKEAKKLAKAKGRIEEKPSTPERINSLKLLESKENQLKLAQEFIRKQNNLQ